LFGWKTKRNGKMVELNSFFFLNFEKYTSGLSDTYDCFLMIIQGGDIFKIIYKG